MPLEPAFAQSLRGKILTISLQTGWGWHKKDASGEWAPFHPPDVLLPVREVELVQPSGAVLGFTGVVESDRAEFAGLLILALTHTKDEVTGDDVIPLGFALSSQPPECTPDATKLLGYWPTPKGAPAFLGFGILVPTDIADKVGP
jgi:hypothetical protein